VKTSTNLAVYVYCIFRSARRPRMTGAPRGVPGGAAPELQVVAGGMWLVTSTVPLDVYGPANLEPRLQDLDWVAQVAVAHEAVNEFFARAAGTVVPMTLFTMFSSTETALKDVRGRRRTIDRIVRHVAGCEEWGIRVTRRPVVIDAGDGSRPRTGAGFLQARKAVRDATASARSAALEAADAAFEQLKRMSKDARRRHPGPESRTTPPILEAAFLVRETARTKFRAEARRQAPILAKAGADMALTGPWPAYSFAREEA